MPYFAPQDVEAARPALLTAMIITGLLSAISLIGGIVAIVLKSSSATTISLLGMKVETGSVGVALIVVALVIAYGVFRLAFKTIEVLDARKP